MPERKVANVMTTKNPQTESVWRVRIPHGLVVHIKQLAKSEGRSATKQLSKILKEALSNGVKK